jgi:hypothetical protein
MKAEVSKSTRQGKKYMAKVQSKDGGTKTVHFGATGYKDFTQHKDEDRKANYLARHKANEDWTDPKTAGFWARHLLWNRPSLQASARELRSKGLQVSIR